MARMCRAVCQQRPNQIREACRKLYETMNFKEITLQDISKEAKLSRPAIYNYFASKEEIFLSLFNKEYELWGQDLQQLLDEHETMTVDEFARAVGKSLVPRKMMLKIQCMNLYEIEENSRPERLVCLKKTIKHVMLTLRDCLRKFFPAMSEENRELFQYTFFPFLYGVYPYVYPTQQQMDAMREACLPIRILSVEEVTYQCIRRLLREPED